MQSSSTSPLIVFISHVSEDAALASQLKDFLESIFLNVNVFVSGRDLSGGQLWMEQLRKSLGSATAIIALTTRFSSDSRWVYFESGAGFVEGRTIPVVADGVTLSTLTAPFKLLQARTYDDAGLKALASDIARLASLREPVRFPGLDKILAESKTFIDLRSAAPAAPASARPSSAPRSAPRVAPSNTPSASASRAAAIVRRARELVMQDVLRREAVFEIPSIEEMRAMKFSDLDSLAKAVGVVMPGMLNLQVMMLEMSPPSPNLPAWEQVNQEKRLAELEKDLDNYAARVVAG
jgi:hypothetical protein